MSLGSFDRAAGYYDATRGLSPDVQRQVAEVLTDALRGAGTSLEIGVGTGRIALPLHARGVRLVGTDVAAAMVARLVANAGGRQPFPLVLSDAAALPFRDAAFDGALACHVLHLIPEWTTVVDEVWRVLRPGAPFLVDFGGGTPAPWSKDIARIFRGHGIEHRRPGVSSVDPVAERLGVAPLPLPEIRVPVERTLGGDLADWEAQIHSWTWPYSAAQIRAACDDVREWARDSGRALGEPACLEQVIRWWSFIRPAA